MIILTREIGQAITIAEITIKILAIEGDKVKIGIIAPEGMDESRILYSEPTEDDGNRS
jgi:carbon storage regulator CsrA